MIAGQHPTAGREQVGAMSAWGYICEAVRPWLQTVIASMVLVGVMACGRSTSAPGTRTYNPGSIEYATPAHDATDDGRAELFARPLRPPALGVGGSCPRSTARIVSPMFGAAAGDGPLYAVGLDSSGVLRYNPENGSAKVLWLLAPSHAGPVLIRGKALGKTQAIRLVGEDMQFDYLLFSGDNRRSAGSVEAWRNWPTLTVVDGPGCYIWQIDGPGFSYTIEFEAVPAS